MYRGEIMNLYVQYIFPLRADPEDGLLWEHQVAYLPQTFKRVLLPVALVNGGDYLYLSLINGEIFFYSHEEDSYSRIEDSFSAILQNLKSDDTPIG
jgi:hypothetical protein